MTFLQNTSRDKESRTLALYYDYLKFINDQWLEAGVIESMDINGVANVIISVSILLCDSSKLDDGYFEDLINSYISAGLKMYIKTKEH